MPIAAIHAERRMLMLLNLYLTYGNGIFVCRIAEKKSKSTKNLMMILKGPAL